MSIHTTIVLFWLWLISLLIIVRKNIKFPLYIMSSIFLPQDITIYTTAWSSDLWNVLTHIFLHSIMCTWPNLWIFFTFLYFPFDVSPVLGRVNYLPSYIMIINTLSCTLSNVYTHVRVPLFFSPDLLTALIFLPILTFLPT